MLFDLTFPCYLTTFSGKKCLSGKVICAFFCPAYRSSPVNFIQSDRARCELRDREALCLHLTAPQPLLRILAIPLQKRGEGLRRGSFIEFVGIACSGIGLERRGGGGGGVLTAGRTVWAGDVDGLGGLHSQFVLLPCRRPNTLSMKSLTVTYQPERIPPMPLQIASHYL
jgi:hypothetical protein